MPNRLVRAVVGAVLLALAGPRPAPAATELVMAVVSPTSDDFQMAMAWSAELAAQASGLRITPVATGTAKGLRLLSQGRADLALIGAPHYLDAVGGTGSFQEDPPGAVAAYRDLRALFAIRSGMGQYVVRADGPVRRFSDLRGRRVSVGRPGGNAGRITTALLKVHGVDAERGEAQTEYLDYAAALDRLGRGEIAAALVWGGVPQAAIDAASHVTPLRFLSPAADSLPALRQALANGSHYAYRAVPAQRIERAYDGRVAVTGDEARFWTFPFMVMVRADLPDATAHALCSVFWNALPAIRGGAPALALVDAREAAQGLSAELHPGARRCLADAGAL